MIITTKRRGWTPEELAEQEKKLDELIPEMRGLPEIREMLVNKKKTPVEIELYGITINVTPAITRQQRKAISEIHQEIQTLGEGEAEPKMYQLCAELCTDKPYNEPAFWQVYDEEIGGAVSAFIKMVEAIQKREQEVINFRKK